jgi:hypothetical protein
MTILTKKWINIWILKKCKLNIETKYNHLQFSKTLQIFRKSLAEVIPIPKPPISHRRSIKIPTHILRETEPASQQIPKNDNPNPNAHAHETRPQQTKRKTAGIPTPENKQLATLCPVCKKLIKAQRFLAI